MTGLLRVEHALHAGRLTLEDLEPGARLVWARAVVLGGSAAGVGTASHVAGNGLLPSLLAMAVLFAAAISIAGLLVLRQVPRPVIIGALVAGQGLMHAVLASLAGHRGAPGAEVSGFLAHQIDHLTAAGPTMIAAHTGGAVLLGFFLSVGEKRLFRYLTDGVLRDHLVGLLSMRAVGVAAGAVPSLIQISSTERRGWAPTPNQLRPRLVWRGPPVLRAVTHST